MSLRVSQTDHNQVHTSTQYMSLQMISDSSTEVVFVVSYNILCNHITGSVHPAAIVEIRARTCSTGMVNLAMYCAKTERVGIVFAGMLTLAFSSVHPGGCTGASQVPSPLSFSAAGIQVRSLCPCRVNWLSKLVMTLPS